SALFFFQAEDGIRDFHVTGVQTCALPILPDLFLKLVDLANAFLLALAQAGFGGDDLAADILQPASRVFADAGKTLLGRYQLLLQQTLLLVTPVTQADQRQIGRASWRGRLVVWLRAVV